MVHGESRWVSGQLVVVGRRGVRVVALGEEPVVIGREPGPTGVVLDGRRVSRRHCWLEPFPAGGHLLVDLGSANGVRVNRRRVRSAVLASGDELRVGEVILVYLDPLAETDGLVGLLDLAHAHTATRLPRLAPRSLEDQLAHLERGLTAADPRSEEELQGMLRECLAGLTCTPAWRSAALALIGEPGGPLQLLAAEGKALDLEARRALVLAALAEQRIVSEPVPGGSEVCWSVPLDHALRAGAMDPPLPEEPRGALLLAGPRSLAPGPAVHQLLGALARRLALFLANVRLRERASLDPLTRLASRARIEQLLEHALARAREVEGSVGVVLLDLDDFKRINDLQGHAAGDLVLHAVAAGIRESLRATDAAGRWGGDEVLLVLPDADPEGAALVARKVIEAVSRTGSVTLSAGVACFPDHAGYAEGLFAAADGALYAAKRGGKDRVRIHRSSDRAEGVRTEVLPPSRGWLCGDRIGCIPLRAGDLTLGRAPTCDVVLPHPSVSRRHAIVTARGAGWAIQDCSTNGTFLNGEPLLGSAIVRLDDRLTVGPYELRFRATPDDPEELESETVPGSWVASRIEEVDLRHLLSGLTEARCTGTLVVRSGSAVGSVDLEGGRCREAALGGLEGAAALEALARLEHGLVSFSGVPEGGPELERILIASQRS